jgi:hypothetical protein
MYENVGSTVVQASVYAGGSKVECGTYISWISLSGDSRISCRDFVHLLEEGKGGVPGPKHTI